MHDWKTILPQPCLQHVFERKWSFDHDGSRTPSPFCVSLLLHKGNKVDQGSLSWSLRFQSKCVRSQDNVPGFFLTEELRKKQQLTRRVTDNLTQHKSTSTQVIASEKKAYVRPVIWTWSKNSPAILTDFILTSPRRSTGKQQALNMENYGKSHVVVMKTSEHSLGFLSFSFKCSCCNTKENYNSCVITKAKR